MLQYAQQREQVRHSMMANLYGSAMPARLNIEKQILTRHVAGTQAVPHPALPRTGCINAPQTVTLPEVHLMTLSSMPACLRRIRRLPGLPSSNICLESMTGELDDFSIESYLGTPAEREVPGVDLHSQVRQHLCVQLQVAHPAAHRQNLTTCVSLTIARAPHDC